MFVFNSLVAFLALAASVSAHSPAGSIHRRHHRIRDISRRTCNPGAAMSASSSAQSASPTANNDEVKTPSSVYHASSTHSSAAAVQTSNVLSFDTLAALAPVANVLESWSTAPPAPKPLPLSDSTFRVHNDLAALPHPYVPAPDGQLSIKATYPRGSWNFQNFPQGGFSFYGPGPADVDLTTAKEVTLGYSVFFEEGFEFNIGGKLPGLCASNCHISRDCQMLTQIRRRW